MGAIVGAILTIPPAAFILDPIIKANVLGQSDVSPDWEPVGKVSEIPDEEPTVFDIEFPITQSYGNPRIAEESGVGKGEEFTIRNAVWLSWKHEVKGPGRQGSIGDELGGSLRPDFMDQKSEGFTEQERQQLVDSINVLSNSCAHLGIYDINGGWVGGPPPRGMYRYTQVKVEEDGKLYVKHEFDIQDRLDAQHPYVV